MPPARGPLWEFFHHGEKQNSAQAKAYCLGCVATKKPDDVPYEHNWEAGIDLNREKKARWFLDACDTVGHVRGDKGPMITHLLGGVRKGDRCPHASKKARAVARKIRDDLDAEKLSSDDDARPVKRRRTATQTRVEENFHQTQLVAFKGVDMPFTDAQIAAIGRQCARATISANLSYRWIEDIEVLRFLMMFRSRACDAVPSRKVLGGRLIAQEGAYTEEKLREILRGKYVSLSTDGWKDGLHNGIASVHLAVNGTSHLVKLSNTNSLGKDGATMQSLFGAMIDAAETAYSCRVVHFGTDNDGGARAGHDKLLKERPWLFATPCMAHQARSPLALYVERSDNAIQGQLINGDYFKESPRAADASAKASEIGGWLHNHNRIRHLFDTVQRELTLQKEPLAYLVGNQTRWTTHTIAFKRLLRLETPLRRGAVFQKEDIIAAQVGAEQRRKQNAALEKAARSMIATIDDGALWSDLRVVVEDVEPITYMTNINQSDDARPDQVVLTFVGVFLHFDKHAVASIKRGMKKRMEKRWSELDQAMFVFALVLNPYEQLSRFGDRANLDHFVLNAELIKLFDRFHSRPPREPQTAEQQEARKAEDEQQRRFLSAAFFEYLAYRGPFASWAEYRDTFEDVHGDNPTIFWEQFVSKPETRALADFAIMLHGICCNQGGCERTFSDLNIKQTRLRNRLGLEKLETMSKVGAQLRQEHLRDGLREERDPRKLHDESRVAQLLAVPRYADALEQDEAGEDDDLEGTRKVALITSGAAWRKELAKWKGNLEDDLDLELESDDDDMATTAPTNARQQAFFPRSLQLLFGGTAARPAEAPGRRSKRKQPSEEALLMELLAAEYEGEPPDDGALEGSDDDFVA